MKTRKLAAFVSTLRYEDLPPVVVEAAKACLLDLLGCCIRGSKEPPAAIIRDLFASESCGRAATVICPHIFAASPMFAALMNGASSHALDMDDAYAPGHCHLGTAVIPAALAVAEEAKASGKALITAIVAGYEVMARVAQSVMPDSYYYWHATSTAGAFGAAAAAGKLLGLDTQRMMYCLGSAGTQAAGLFEFMRDGADSKVLHAAKACFNGVLSACLARKGFTAAERILEGEKGFCKAMMKDPPLEKLTEGLGETWAILENCFKPYTCCRWTHSAIDAARQLRKEHSIDPGHIQSILVKAHPMALDMVDNADPKTVYGCKFSIQYCVALVLHKGQAWVDDFSEANMHDPEIRRVTALCGTEPAVTYEPDGKLQDKNSELFITMKNGGIYHARVPYPLGNPENPMTFDELNGKFASLASSCYDEEHMRNISALCRNLDQVADFSAAFSFLKV